MIDWFAKELHLKEVATLWLLGKASKLPFCRRHILVYKIVEWDNYITRLCLSIMHGHKIQRPVVNVNDRVKNFLLKSKQVNNNFLEFFFTFHRTISTRFENQILRIVESDYDLKTKVCSLFFLYRDLMNLTRIELEGFEIDCEVIGNNYICSNHECKTQPNVITLMITPEYVEDKSIIESIIEVLERFIKPFSIRLVIDYRNLCSYVSEYDWEKAGAYCRYKKCKKFVKDIYFYKTDCVNFGKYSDELRPYIIKNKKELLQKVYGKEVKGV